MKVVDDWISSIRAEYQGKGLPSIEKDIKIVTQLLVKAEKSISSGLPETIRKEWEAVMPRLISLHKNLEKQKNRLVDGIQKIIS